MLSLPPALAPLGAYRQFVAYRLVPSVRKAGKMDKVPINPATGYGASSTDPTHWATFDEARAAVAAGKGHGVGFVFTAADPFWFVDIDGALQPDGTWSPMAIDLCQRLGGAAVEISQSNTGLHIIGSGAVPEHGCRNIPLGLELYTEHRFVALTGSQPSGSVLADLTPAIAEVAGRLFPSGPKRADNAPDDWTSEPVEAWDGPTDDADLIRMATASADRSAAAAFGGDGVTFRDLWERNVDALAKRWPSETNGDFDGSAADASLAAHLAFWTGKNCERIRDLMYQSGLVRDKWEARGDYYLPRTIQRACALSGDVAKGKSVPLVSIGRDLSSQISIQATPYDWPDPAKLPTRQWLVGQWLLKGEVTAVIAPGGSGKSTIAHTIALCLASGQALLGEPVYCGQQGVWIFNLEDGLDELQRQISAACAFHKINQEDCGERLHLDSGLVQPLRTANELGDGFALNEEVFAQLKATILDRRIAAVIVDPFVSSHAVRESSNEAIDAITKRWKRLAQETGCAIILVHHTRKLGGREATAEDGRGAVALRDAARIVLTLNPMGEREAEELGIIDRQARRSLIRVDVGKANRAPTGAVRWIRLESQSLENGSEPEPSDFVGVAALWEKPDFYTSDNDEYLHEIQQRLATEDWRENVQARDWVGNLIAEVMGLSAETHKAQIKMMIRAWRNGGSLLVERRADKNGDERPFIAAGKTVRLNAVTAGHHLPECGAESAEGVAPTPG